MTLIVEVETRERDECRRVARKWVTLCSYLQCQMFEEQRYFASEYVLLLLRKGKRTTLPKLTSKNCWSKDVT